MNTVKTAFFLGLLSGLILLIGGALAGRTGLVMALGIAAVMNFFSYWFSDRLVLAMHRAQPATREQAPQLFEILERLTSRASIPMPRVYVLPEEAPNAFATGRNPHHAAVAVTRGIMKVLSPEELEGVLAHELAHVKNRDTLINAIVAMMASTIMIIAMFARWSLFFGLMFGGRGRGGGAAAGQLAATLVLAIAAPIVAGLIQMAVSRAREYGADEMGARNSRDPEALASALQKLQLATQQPQIQQAAKAISGMETANHMFIVNPLAGGPGRWFASHPPVEDRVARLREVGREIGQIF